MAHFAIQHGSRVRNQVCGAAAFATTRAVAVAIEPDSVPSEAQAWLASLPLPLGGRSMAQLAPGITTQIAAVWNDVSLTSRLLEHLLIGDGVASQSSAVTSTLLRLYEYNARCRAHDAPDTTWELPVSRLQPFSSDSALQGSPL